MNLFGKIILSDTSDFTRFNIYAPWVQQLEVFSSVTIYKLRYYKELVDVVAKRPLLPNLRTLSLSTNLKVPSENYESLVKLFVCPSLVEIRHKADYFPQYYLEASSAHLLIQRISAACPSLQRLEFYPDVDEYSLRERSRLVSSPNAAFPRILAGFSNLRSFSSTAFIFEPAILHALGGLPLLETLSIVEYNLAVQKPPTLGEDFHVLDTWFPALRNLQLYDLDPREITAIWKQPRFVQKLNAVTVRCYPGALDDDHMEPMNGQPWIDMFLSGLPRASPHIAQLDVEIDNLAFELQKKYSLSNARDDLRQLPLCSTRLQFSGILLDLWDDSVSVNAGSSDEEVQETNV
ncbi:hypothetical protein BDV93DRAFT_512209 [Ceratobasidium sp. AG-I]|nr:hypothetical protein BDV93DRAFT_512209 [Ceratobasidium sp. AG-I]